LSVAIAVKGYYDGSGAGSTKHRGKIISLAGYAATPAAWNSFETDWWRVLADDAKRPICRCLHMTDANSLRKDFDRSLGWTETAVRSLLADLLNQCFSPRGFGCDISEALIGAACSVDLRAYERVCQEYPHFRQKTPEALCVDHVVGVAIQRLVPSDVDRISFRDLVDRKQSVALFFDRGELYRHQILRVWEAFAWHKRPMPLRLVSEIGTADQESSAALQAADFLAWHTTRDVASVAGDLSARMKASLSAGCAFQHYDDDELAKTASRWRLNQGYDAVSE
jgi:hypothetical protein